jgi:hypothetical protein
VDAPSRAPSRVEAFREAFGVNNPNAPEAVVSLMVDAYANGGSSDVQRQSDIAWQEWLTRAGSLGEPATPSVAGLLAVIAAAPPEDAWRIKFIRSTVSRFEWQARELGTSHVAPPISKDSQVSAAFTHKFPKTRSKPRYDDIFDAAALVRFSVAVCNPLVERVTASWEGPIVWPMEESDLQGASAACEAYYSSQTSTRTYDEALRFSRHFTVVAQCLHLRRFEDATHLHLGDLKITDTSVHLVFSETKNEKSKPTSIILPRRVPWQGTSSSIDFGEWMLTYIILTFRSREATVDSFNELSTGSTAPVSRRETGLFQPVKPRVLRRKAGSARDARKEPPNLSYSADAISNLVKAGLDDAGIDTSVYKPYSIRCAITTFYLDNGVAEHIVQRLGGWKSLETMRDFYNRMKSSRAITLQAIEAAVKGQDVLSLLRSDPTSDGLKGLESEQDWSPPEGVTVDVSAGWQGEAPATSASAASTASQATAVAAADG